MKINKIIQTTLGKILTILSCVFCFGVTMAQQTYNFHPEQKLVGNNGHQLKYISNHPDLSSMVFLDKEGTEYGHIYGSKNGENFGLLDGDGNWSYVIAKNKYIAFKINNIDMMTILSQGYVGIGTTQPRNELDVCGVIRAKEVLVEDGWCDYVFEPEYCLTTLEEEAKFIQLYGHLSNFESAKAMDGMINVNDIFKRQQVQIEENVLHLIELNEENNVLQTQVDALEVEVASLAETNKNLEERLAALEAKVR